MNAIAQAFCEEMDRVGAFLDAIVASYGVAKEDPKGITSRKRFILNARKLHKTIDHCSDLNLVGYAGAYLHVCAEYERTVRNLIERYVEAAVTKCEKYHHLPEEIRDWYPYGCAELIRNISQDKFKHLTVPSIVGSLASISKNSKYSLIGDAFSDNQNNFWPETINTVFCKRLGIKKIWQKLAREKPFQKALGTHNPDTVEQVAKQTLSQLLQRRNDTIHRGKSYFVPSDNEVRQCISFLRCFITSLAQVMEGQHSAI